MSDADVEAQLASKLAGQPADIKEDIPDVVDDDTPATLDRAELPDSEAEKDLARDAGEPVEEAPAEPVAEQAAEESDDTIDFEHEGRSYKVPKPLVDGALRQQDYTTKMQELANERKYVAAERLRMQVESQVSQSLAPSLAQLQNIDQHIASLKGQAPDPGEDPVGYLRFNKQVSDLRDARQELSTQIEQTRTELLRQKQSADAELLRAGFAVLQRDIPKWGPEVQADVAKRMQSVGFTPEELGSFTDPRVIKLAYESIQYQRMKDGLATTAAKKVAEAPKPVVKPTSSVPNSTKPMQDRVQALKKQAMRTGKTQDAEAALLAVIQAQRAKRR